MNMMNSSYNNSQVTVDSITNESYVSPEMQWTILSLKKPNFMIINKTTGAVQNIPTVGEILTIINKQLFSPSSINDEHKESLKNVLHVMLEATHIASSTVSIKMAYQEADFANRNDLLTSLNAQKVAIQTTLNKVKAINQSYSSWMFGSGGPSKAQKLLAINPTQISFDNYATTISIPAHVMPSIIQLNDYKQQPDATLAANLLFKQCFIAQQQHGPNPIALNLNNPFGAANYIYNNFPKIYIKYSNSYPICDDILTLDFSQRRARLLQIRQAVQTALSIANKKSGANTGFQYLTSLFDGVVSELMRYDTYLGILCKNPNYGATADDMAQSGEWSTMSKVAAGIIVVGGALAVAHYVDPKILPNAYNATSGALQSSYSTAAGTLQSGYNATSSALQSGYSTASSSLPQTSDVMSWLSKSNSQPMYGPIAPPQPAPMYGPIAPVKLARDLNELIDMYDYR
jgi:hypothetical protein